MEESTTLELETGPIAAGGGCVARAPDGRVVFVRHALPGESVRAVVTSETKSFLRADAVEIRRASPDRVVPPCPHAGPGRCGGCDWQHVTLERQRELKADLVAEQLRRLAGIDLRPEVEPLPGDEDGLGWRTRVRFAVDEGGSAGLRRHRSHDLEPIDRCLIAAPGVDAVAAQRHEWPGVEEFEVVSSDEVGETFVDVTSRRARVREVPNLDAGFIVDNKAIRAPVEVHFPVLGRVFRVSPGVFWQVHTRAATTLASVVLDGLQARPGEHVVDLYAGAGLFAALLGAEVGRNGRVLAVERDARACSDAIANTSDLRSVEIRRASITERFVSERLEPSDLLILDPSREGVGVGTMRALLAMRPRPRRIAYVACDPASFARDLKVALDEGWRLASLRAFDLFPMTEHVECVGMLEHPGD